MNRRAWMLVLLAIMLGLIPEAMIARALLVANAPHFPASIHTAPLARDFSQFWSAGWLIDHGQTATLFHPARFHAWVVARFPFLTGHYRWGYPPGMALLMAPLGVLPPLAAWTVWMLGGTTALVLAMRVVFGARNLALLALIVLTLPIYWDNLLAGQNALFTGALMVLGFGLLERRPVLAGIALGPGSRSLGILRFYEAA